MSTPLVSTLVCDQFIRKCTKANLACSSMVDCPSGQYCAPADPTVSGSVATCTPYITGDRTGAICDTTNVGQCGWLYFCTTLNPLESNTLFQRKVCMAPFSVPEGGICQADSSCASGQCRSNRCTEPDWATHGLACGGDADCGRLMVCSCPSQGPGRQHCVPAPGLVTANNQRAGWGRVSDYFQCLEAYGCQFSDPIVGSCGWNNCRSKLNDYVYGDGAPMYSINLPAQMQSPKTCSNIYGTDDADYRGYEEIINAAPQQLASLAVVALVSIFSLWNML